MRIEGQSPGGGGTARGTFPVFQPYLTVSTVTRWDKQTCPEGGSGPCERAHPWGL